MRITGFRTLLLQDIGGNKLEGLPESHPECPEHPRASSGSPTAFACANPYPVRPKLAKAWKSASRIAGILSPGLPEIPEGIGATWYHFRYSGRAIKNPNLLPMQILSEHEPLQTIGTLPHRHQPSETSRNTGISITMMAQP